MVGEAGGILMNFAIASIILNLASVLCVNIAIVSMIVGDTRVEFEVTKGLGTGTCVHVDEKETAK